MPTTVTVADPYAYIDEGPSRTDLLLALFDRKRPEPVSFTVTQEDPRVLQRVQVVLSGLLHHGHGKNVWEFEGRMTGDSPIKPREFVAGFYNDHDRKGTFNEVTTTTT